MEPENPIEPAPEIEAIQPKNFFSRLGGVYLSPKNTFQEIGGSPSIWVPMLVMIIMGGLMGFYLIHTADFHSIAVSQLEKQAEQGKLTEDVMQQRLPLMETIIKAFILAAAALGSIFFALIVAGFAKLFSALAGAQNRFKAIFSVTAFTMIAISIIQSLLTVLILHFKGTADLDLQNLNSVVASNLGAVLQNLLGNDVLPKFAIELAKAIDVFAIWMIALLSIGYAAVSQKLKTSTAAIWLTSAYAIIAIIGAAFRAVFQP
jgi:hypothetical protein